MENEVWLPVVGYEGYYEVSNHGGVRNSATRKLVGSVDKFGYAKVTLTTRDSKRDYRVHRIVLNAFAGINPGDRPFGLHRDGDKLNNALSNLYWGDQKENMQDAIRHGTHVNVAKTSCPSGHEYTQENTRVNKKNGWRVCKSCHRARESVRKEAASAT